MPPTGEPTATLNAVWSGSIHRRDLHQSDRGVVPHERSVHVGIASSKKTAQLHVARAR